jgi:hypothetical protein
MLNCEKKWYYARQPLEEDVQELLRLACNRPMSIPLNLPTGVRDLRSNLDILATSSTHYRLARFQQIYSLPICGLVYPLWAHERDVPTMQAAHAKNPDLGAYLQDKAYTWSSHYIAADLQVDVWAARVCLDLYGLHTPNAGNKPKDGPRAEATYVHDGAKLQELFRRGFNTAQVATELGVTEHFLHANWRELRIHPQFGTTRDRALESSLPRNAKSEISQRRFEWLTVLKDTHLDRKIKSVADARYAWDVTYPTARARLVALGWVPGEPVDLWLGAQP